MALFRSIRSKIIVGIVSLLVVLAVALTVVATGYTQDALRSEISQTHEARAEKIAQDLEALMQDAIEIAAATARNPAFREPVPDSARGPDGLVAADREQDKRLVLGPTVEVSTLLSGAYLVDLEGAVILAEPFALQASVGELRPGPGGAAPFAVLLAQMQQVLDAARPGQGPTFVERGDQPGSWVVASPVFHYNGSTVAFGGLIVFTGANDPLVAFVNDEATTPAHSILIVDDQGIVVAGAEPFAPGTDLRGPVNRLADASGGTRTVELAGTEHLASIYPVRGTDWHLLLATDADAAFAAVDGIVRTTAVLGGAALIFGVVMSLVLAQDLSTPVRRLQRAAQRVTAGEYGTQVRVSTRDELADLAGAFNAMSARLQEEHQRLLRHQEELEDTVEERTRELREKNDELEAFVYAASHDLRTPIISLDWLVQELREQLQPHEMDAEVGRTLERMQANVEGMDRLVADLLELSRIGRTEGEPGAVPLDEVVAQVLDEMAPRIREKAVEVRVELEDAPVVLADRRRMHQVFGNLIANAVKYGRDKGGKVLIRATPIGAPERPWKWRVEVVDDGPGVPPEYRERVFLLFQRAPDPLGRVIQGTGVGLALVRKIVRAYGGDIKVADAPGGGAMFWFTLPAPRVRNAPAPADPGAAGVPAADSAPGGHPPGEKAPRVRNVPEASVYPPGAGRKEGQ